MRTFLFIFFSVVCQLIFAQTIKKDKPRGFYHSRLVTSDGRAMTNCVFSEAKVDESGYWATVTWSGHTLLLDNEARLIVPHSIYKSNLIEGGFYHDKTGNEATKNIYDYHGNVLEENVKSLKSNGTLNTRDGKTIRYYMLTTANDDNYFCGPNLARLRKAESCTANSEILLIKDGLTQYVTDLIGNVVVDKCDKIEICELSRFFYNLYSNEELNRFKFVFAYTSTMVSVYTVNGKLLYSERVAKNENKRYKQRKKIVTKKLAELCSNRKIFEEAYYDLVDRVIEYSNTHQPQAKAQQMMSFSKYMSDHSPLHIFPVVQSYEDSIKESPSLIKKLTQNKFGKIKNYKRCVEEDGFVYYKVQYIQGLQGTLDSKGDVLVPPTKYSIVYHSSSQTLNSYETIDDIHYTHQIYNWDGKLLLDCDKKKIDYASLRIEDDNRCYFTVRKNGKQGIYDYFGVQLTPIDYSLNGTLFFSSVSETFEFSENGSYIDTKYSLPKTSRPGGKPSVARKFPSSEVAKKDNSEKKANGITAQKGTNKSSSGKGNHSTGGSISAQKTPDLSVNRSFTNGGRTIEDLNKANRKFATPAYATIPQGDYYYLCKDGTNCVVKIQVVERDGKLMALTLDTHYSIGVEHFKYTPNKNTEDYFYFQGVLLINWNSQGYGMDLYIAKDWSRVILTTNYGSIFDRQCSEREYIKSLIDYKPTSGGFSFDIDNRRSKAAQQHMNQMQQDIQAEIRALESGTSRSSQSGSSYNSNNNRPSVRVKQYSPNYTGSSEKVWCKECNAWDYPHVHINKTY